MTQEIANDIKGFVADNLHLLKGATITMVSGKKYKLSKYDIECYAESDDTYVVMYHGDDGIEYLNPNFIESFKVNLSPEE